VIEFQGIRKAFGPKHVLKGIDLTIPDGEVFFLIGSSGAGKSVLIKHLIGLLKPDAGKIILDGHDVSALEGEDLYRVRKLCAMVFQHATLFDSMTCAENVALPLRKHRGLSTKQALSEARDRLVQVHMADYADRYPGELGDGMRKRVAIARALTVDPRYVLFDEPTTSLDPVSARRVDRLIRELSDRLGGDQRGGEPRPGVHLLHRRPGGHALPGQPPDGGHARGVSRRGRPHRAAIRGGAGRRADGSLRVLSPAGAEGFGVSSPPSQWQPNAPWR
jgi:phospholipid/cholesterol/gamma-HCH transport system ATP-binding protein